MSYQQKSLELACEIDICRKPKDSDAIKSLLEMVNPIFFSGISQNTLIRDPFGSTWPDHFSKADDGPATRISLYSLLCNKPV